MARSNTLFMFLFSILGLISFGLINYATNPGIFFFAAAAITFWVVAITFYQTERIEKRLDEIEDRIRKFPAS